MADSFLNLLALYEPIIRRYVPTVRFLFGEEERERLKGGWWVIWDIDGGDPGKVDPRAPVQSKSDPKAFDEDEVIFSAICYGEGKVNPADRDRRKAEYAASEHLMSVVRYAVKITRPGVSRFTGWTLLAPAGPGDHGAPIQADFRANMQLLTPEIPTVVPETIEHEPFFEV